LKGSVKGNRTITLSLYRQAKGFLNLVPGKKLCNACFNTVNELVGNNEEIESSQSPDHVTPESSQLEAAPQELLTEVSGLDASVNPSDLPSTAASSEQPDHLPPPTESNPVEDLPRLRPRNVRFASDSSSSSSHPASQPKSAASSPGFEPKSESLQKLNNLLNKLGISAVDKNKLKFKAKYGSDKFQEICEVIHQLMTENAGNNIFSICS
jgi:hypothetical protein